MLPGNWFDNADFYAAYGTFEQLPKPEKPEIVFVGRSNVGKSSLINKIFSRKSLARVSSEPGKTRTINFYNQGKIYFVDLPGYGYAKVSKSDKERWNKLISGYLSDPERDIAIVFSLIDMRHPPTADDITMINFLIDAELPFCIVLTKSDKLNKSERAARLEALKSEIPYFSQITIIPFSALTGEGTKEIREVIGEVVDEEA
ncbi:MAG: ribosome biogenesis GTP-binding protein YihA/YsxC [Oscillospiraceae bacterium]|nr:ribosome biogenesis GTP-binding protein YihA/YsxC [Oscillospiraceae bacterium]